MSQTQKRVSNQSDLKFLEEGLFLSPLEIFIFSDEQSFSHCICITQWERYLNMDLGIFNYHNS